MSWEDFKSRADAEAHRYGVWGGRPSGVPYDPARCAASVIPNERGAISQQCRRKPGHGPAGLFCSPHSPEGITKSAEAAQRRWNEKVNNDPYVHMRAERDRERELADTLGRALDLMVRAAQHHPSAGQGREALRQWREARARL